MAQMSNDTGAGSAGVMGAGLHSDRKSLRVRRIAIVVS
jgi:hypothetical protein